MHASASHAGQSACDGCRVGTYTGHSGRIIQLLSLGDVLLSLGDDRKLLVWSTKTFDAPKVGCIRCTFA